MKKSIIINKNDLRRKFLLMMQIHLDSIGKKKNKKLRKYLDRTLDNVVDYYECLAKKEDRIGKIKDTIKVQLDSRYMPGQESDNVDQFAIPGSTVKVQAGC